MVDYKNTEFALAVVPEFMNDCRITINYPFSEYTDFWMTGFMRWYTPPDRGSSYIREYMHGGGTKCKIYMMNYSFDDCILQFIELLKYETRAQEFL